MAMVAAGRLGADEGGGGGGGGGEAAPTGRGRKRSEKDDWDDENREVGGGLAAGQLRFLLIKVLLS